VVAILLLLSADGRLNIAKPTPDYKHAGYRSVTSFVSEPTYLFFLLRPRPSFCYSTWMQLKLRILAESSRTYNGVEYTTATGMESGPSPLLQMVDYGLREEEKQHKGKLVGKEIVVRVEFIRDMFSGRPQCVGRIDSIGN